MNSSTLRCLEDQLRRITRTYSREDWEANKDGLSRIRALTVKPRTPASAPANRAPADGPVKSLPDLMALPVSGRSSSGAVEPTTGIIERETDVTKYCDAEKVPGKVAATAKVVFRALARPDSLYSNIWHGSDFYTTGGSTACRLLEAEVAITNDQDLNGARYRINALLFALHYNAQIQELGSRANRESIVMERLLKESCKTRRQVEFLLQRGRWLALWVNQFGLGAILALGESIASSNNMREDLGHLVKVCEAISGFRQRSKNLFNFARKGVEEAVALSTSSREAQMTPQTTHRLIDYPRSGSKPRETDQLGSDTSDLVARRGSAYDQRAMGETQDLNQSLVQPSSNTVGVYQETEVYPGNNPLDTLAEVAQSELQEGDGTQQVSPHHQTGEDPELPSAALNTTATTQQICGQSLLPQWQSSIGSSWPQEAATQHGLLVSAPTGSASETDQTGMATGDDTMGWQSSTDGFYTGAYYGQLLEELW